MRIVVALGGNALLRRGERPDASTQQANIRTAVTSIAAVARHHDVVITHGNGPQVGLLALESEQDPALERPYPLDVIGAETEGMVGYWLQRELTNAMPDRQVAALLTQTLVDPADPGFENPSKFVGQVYDEATATSIARDRGWTIKRDGLHWRRVVASPAPRGFVELPVIQLLVDQKVLTICAGGGGVPVMRTDGGLMGVEAVVDKDLSAALLAKELRADALLLLTDVPHVELHHGTPDARALTHVTPEELKTFAFPAGSMGPKVEAACGFVHAGGRFAAIGSLADAAAILAGAAGTIITRE